MNKKLINNEAPWMENIQATDHGNPPLSGSALIRVKILDVNDNYPTFIDPPFVIPLAENSPPNVIIATVHAEDADEGKYGDIHYSLFNHTDDFVIDERIKFYLMLVIEEGKWK